MTTHARAGLARVLAGSVTIGVLQRVRCPVLVVRPTTPVPAANAAVTLTPVLVPLDGSPLAEEVLDAAVRVLGSDALSIHLIHVLSSESAGRDWEQYLGGLAEQLSAQGISTTWSLRRGSVVDAIAGAAAEISAGLIAMTTRGASGFRERLFGSTAENVLRTVRLPSLLIRACPAERGDEGAAGSVGLPDIDAHHLTLRARDLMTSPAITVSPDDTLEHVARTMLEHGIGAVPVVDEAGQLLGIISEHDLMAQEQGLPFSVYRAPQLFGHWLPPEGLEEVYSLGRSLQARTVMRQPVVTVGEDATATQIAELMLETGRTHLPVVRDSRVVGMVTRHDLLKLLARGSQSSL
jgi:CBS domain-containing protein